MENITVAPYVAIATYLGDNQIFNSLMHILELLARV